MKKRILKLSALAVALALTVGIILFANSLVGNPVSRLMATNTAKNHLAEHYADRDFTVDGVIFSFKHGYYHAYISSPSSVDSSFTLAIALDGELIHDYYEDRVINRWNTADRIGRDYRNAVDAVLNSPSFPYNEHIGYGDLEFISEEYKNDPSVPEYAIVTNTLILDGFYNASELGAEAGKLTIYLEDETVSYERLAEIILDVKKIFDSAGVKFYVLDLVLEYPKQTDGTKKEDRVEVMDFLYSDIHEDGMTDRVKASDEAAKAYYAEQDTEKFKEKVEENK